MKPKCKNIEEHVKIVEQESIFYGFDDYAIVKVRTKFKVGDKVKVTIELIN